MEHLFKGIPGVVVYIDDILITGKDEPSHLKSLEEVLKKLSESGLRLKKDKCLFLVSSVVFLGHKIDSAGLHPLPDKIEAIEAAPTPSSVTELKAYLGLLTYSGKFLPKLSTRLGPLYELLKKGIVWKWTTACDRAF